MIQRVVLSGGHFATFWKTSYFRATLYCKDAKKMSSLDNAGNYWSLVCALRRSRSGVTWRFSSPTPSYRGLCSFLVSWGEMRLSALGISPLFGLLYQPQMIDDDECGAVCGMKIGKGNRSTRRKPTSVPLFSAENPT